MFTGCLFDTPPGRGYCTCSAVGCGRPGAEFSGVTMIEALKDNSLVEKTGGRFKLCTLIQRRLEQLVDGERPLIERGDRSDLEVVIEEIKQDLITLEFVGDGTGGANEQSEALL